MFINLLKNKDGTLRAFEVNETYVSLYRLGECISKMPGVTITKKSKPYWRSFAWSYCGVNARVEFSYKGYDFEIDGESDFLWGHWIGPRQTKETYPGIDEILKHVEATAISEKRRRFCDLLTLDLKNAFCRKQ